MRAARVAGIVLLATTSVAAFAASAQEQQPEQVESREIRSQGLEMIVVTAQKREDSLQDTPVAVSAITSETIEALNISEADDLTAVAPNVMTTQTTSSTTNIAVFIRGIGEADPILTADPPVGLYVDGVVIGRSAGAIFDIVDLERIEVLRGPQGTLYGRNTTGGAINLITEPPLEFFEVEGELSYGNFDYVQARASVDSGELGDSGFAAKLSYVHKQRDGYFDDLNQPDDQDPGAYNLDALRIAVQYDKGGPFSADYAFDYNDRDSWPIPFQLAAVRPDILSYLQASPQLGGTAPLISRDKLDAIRLEQGESFDEVQGHTLRLEYDFSDQLTLRSLTGYRKWDNRAFGGDLDGNAGLVGFTVSPAILAPPFAFIPEGVNPINLFAASNERHQDQWSQEFNLLGEYDDFNFVLGAFYFTEDASERNPQSFTLIIPSPAPIPITPDVTLNSFGVNLSTLYDYDHESTSRALFGQLTYAFTDQLSVTGGLRYTKDEKQLDQRAPIARELEADFNETTWAASVNYDVTDDILTYVRVATGYKAGGFNARSVNAGFEPETITSYEVGLKSELLDRTLRLNLAAFYSEYDDLQVQQFLAGTGGASSITVNAGSATYQGFEAEFTAVPIEGLTLTGAFGYVDRDYLSFVVRNPVTNELIDVADEAKFRYAPDVTLNLGAEYVFEPTRYGTPSVRLGYLYRGDVVWDTLERFAPRTPIIADDAVGTFNGRVSLADIEVGGADARVSLWGQNLTDEDYLLSGIDFGALGFAGVAWAEGRTYGIDVKVAF